MISTKELSAALGFVFGAFVLCALPGSIGAQTSTPAPSPVAPAQPSAPVTAPSPTTPAAAQTAATPAVAPTPATPPAQPADVNSMDAIIAALYDVISGPAGKKRDFNRLRSLFHPSARLTPTGPRRAGGFGARALTVEEYITSSGPFMEREGFFEREVARRVEQFGHVAHVFSTYESRHKADDQKPFARGINSIQLFNDGGRWWVMSILWANETPQQPLPDKYLKSAP